MNGLGSGVDGQRLLDGGLTTGGRQRLLVQQRARERVVTGVGFLCFCEVRFREGATVGAELVFRSVIGKRGRRDGN